MLSAIVSFVVVLLVAALVIWIVSKLNLGLSVDSFMSAIWAALVIALITAVIMWLLGLLGISLSGGWLGAIIALIIAAVVLMISDKFLSGMQVKGFGGAIIAAIAIGVGHWLISWLIGLLGITG
jgi:putative membrane protein